MLVLALVFWFVVCILHYRYGRSWVSAFGWAVMGAAVGLLVLGAIVAGMEWLIHYNTAR